MSQLVNQPTALPGPGTGSGLWGGVSVLWRRELVRFVRQKNRIASALLTPVLLWIGLGAGLDQAVWVGGGSGIGEAAGGIDASGNGLGYMSYFFPGTLSMIVLFTAVFSAMSVIEDRREGFMQGVLVAPVPRLSVVLGKVLGGSSIAMVQACVFLLLWPIVGAFPGWGWALAAAGTLALMSVGMTALGLCIAWPMNSTAGFHAVMMLLLMPMWFLSGAVFPVSTAMPWLRPLMWANPLTYGQAVLSRSLLGYDAVVTGLPAWGDAALMGLAVAGALALSVRLVSKPRKDGT